MKTAALYLRVSTSDQVDRYSLPAQRRALVDYCERHGWDYTVYEDPGISGETLDARPAMLRLLRDARERRFQVALAIEMERFSRSRDGIDLAMIKRVFRESGIRFGTPAQIYDPDDIEDDFTSGMLALLASREKQKINQRTLRGKLEASRQGRYISSHAPYGYRLAGERQGKLVIHADEARVVRSIFAMLISGKGSRAIAQTLTDRGIPSPRRKQRAWARSTILRIVTNPAYAGRAAYNRRQRHGTVLRGRPEADWISVPVPRIVADDVFRQAQDALRHNTILAPRNQRQPYLLKGLVRCGVCGRTMSGVPHHGVRYHRCNGRSRLVSDPPCSTPAVRAEVLEALVWGQLKTLLRQPDLILAAARRRRESQLTDRDEVAMRLDGVRNSLQQVPLERERVLTAYREGWATSEEARAQLAQLDRKRANLTEDQHTLESRLSIRTASEEQAERLEAIVAKVRRRLEHLSFVERFEVLHAFIHRVVVSPDGDVELHAFVPLSDKGSDDIQCDQYVSTL
jgi:site-specific DNA recombinase